jgi:osmotically-inducible protein OsmY
MLAVLVVANVAVAQPAGPTMGERVDDARVTAKVKAKLVTDRAQNLVSVNVGTRDGVVRLQGTVPTDQVRMQAERLAKETQDVRSVKNDLKVRTGGAASPDVEIARTLNRTLKRIS